MSKEKAEKKEIKFFDCRPEKYAFSKKHTMNPRDCKNGKYCCIYYKECMKELGREKELEDV